MNTSRAIDKYSATNIKPLFMKLTVLDNSSVQHSRSVDEEVHPQMYSTCTYTYTNHTGTAHSTDAVSLSLFS